MTQNPLNAFFNSDQDRRKVEQALRKVDELYRQRNRQNNFGNPPPCLFGRITNVWEFPETTVNIQPVRFDDFTDITTSDELTVYIGYHDLPVYLGTQLSQNNIVPYLPFQGDDSEGVNGILAGSFLYPDLVAFGEQYFIDTDNDDKPSVKINEGNVFIGDSSDPTAVEQPGATTGYPLETSTYLWVEMTITPNDGAAPTISINSEIQNGSEPDYWDFTTSTGVLTIKWIIGYIDTGKQYISRQRGDIHLLYPFQPGYHEDIQGNYVTSAKLLGLKDRIDFASADEYFFEGRSSVHQFEGGGLRLVSDGVQTRWGGKTLANSIFHVDSVTTVADAITFQRKQMVNSYKAGLLQSASDSDTTDFILKALGKWMGINTGSTIYHKNSPATSTSDDDHWFDVEITITGGISIDGGAATDSIRLYFDRKGHLWKYDSSTQPSVENYEYEHCSDPSSNPNIVFADDEGAFLESDGECYKRLGTTEADATDPTPTLGATYASCAACEAAVTSEVWRRCDNDTTVGVFAAGNAPAGNYAWGCLSNTYAKTYFYQNTVDTESTFEFVEPDNSPTSCEDSWEKDSVDLTGTSCDPYACEDPYPTTVIIDDFSVNMFDLCGSRNFPATPWDGKLYADGSNPVYPNSYVNGNRFDLEGGSPAPDFHLEDSANSSFKPEMKRGQ